MPIITRGRCGHFSAEGALLSPFEKKNVNQSSSDFSRFFFREFRGSKLTLKPRKNENKEADDEQSSRPEQ